LNEFLCPNYTSAISSEIAPSFLLIFAPREKNAACAAGKSFWKLKHLRIICEKALSLLIGLRAFTALSIYSPFQNPVNPPILLFGWLNKVISLLQNGASPGTSWAVLSSCQG
jgi:hypothetical protein